MDLKRLPPSLLVALGLAGCGPAVDDGLTGGDSGDSQTSTGGTSGTTATTVGPCLDVGESVGPCLEPPPMMTSGGTTGTGGETGSSTNMSSTGEGGTDTGTTGGDGTGSGTTGAAETGTGPCLVPPGVPPMAEDDRSGAFDPPASQARSEILNRLLEAGVLPVDVAARLALPTDDDS